MTSRWLIFYHFCRLPKRANTTIPPVRERFLYLYRAPRASETAPGRTLSVRQGPPLAKWQNTSKIWPKVLISSSRAVFGKYARIIPRSLFPSVQSDLDKSPPQSSATHPNSSRRHLPYSAYERPLLVNPIPIVSIRYFRSSYEVPSGICIY